MNLSMTEIWIRKGVKNMNMFEAMIKDKEPAYIIEYVNEIIDLTALVFTKLEEMEEYDTFSLIDAYMRHSEIRRKMDEGNWSALNKGHKQVLNSIDYSLGKPNDHSMELDGILLDWMARIYVLLQWAYRIPSAEISRVLPAAELCRTYNPLHETSEKTACEKLIHKYFLEYEENKDNQTKAEER